jgi:hypothetical protein
MCDVFPSHGIAGVAASAEGAGHEHRLSPPEASAASIAAITRSVSAPHHLARAENVALNRVVDLRPRYAPLDVLRDVAVGEPGMARASPREIENPELPRLERGILREHLDDLCGIGPLLELGEHQHLIRVGPVDRCLAGRDSLPRNDDRLHAAQERVIAIYTGRRRDHDPSGREIDGDHRPGGERGRRQECREAEERRDAARGAGQRANRSGAGEKGHRSGDGSPQPAFDSRQAASRARPSVDCLGRLPQLR